MRTPWRFVADLVSRNPKGATREEHSANASQLIALEHQPENTDGDPEIEMQPAELPIEIAVEDRVDAARHNIGSNLESVQISEEPFASAVDEVSATSADAKNTAVIDVAAEIEEILAAEEETPTPDELAKPVEMPELKRRKPPRPDVQQPEPLSQPGDNAPAVAKSFMHEMVDLDAEVDALRRQLAEKLSEQNAQLRKMLARFDSE